MGLDQAAFPAGAQGLNLPALMRRCDRWDFSLSANAHTTQVWARAYPCGYETLEYGYPRNDRLALAGPSEVAAARALLDVHDQRSIILYAPTFREHQSGFTPPLDVDELADALGDVLGPDVLVLLRAHYFYPDRTGPPAPGYRRVRDGSSHPCVEDLLLATDVLVTDYSSVMFDFGVLDRPIVVYAPDWEAYRSTRGVTFDLLAEPPGAVATTQPGLHDAFRTGAVWDDAATKARQVFRARFCALDDGHAAHRVVWRVFGPDGLGAADPGVRP
jgi:CDP-glycerol glycerophosphotransferase